jgi:hypothetical protein
LQGTWASQGEICWWSDLEALGQALNAGARIRRERTFVWKLNLRDQLIIRGVAHTTQTLLRIRKVASWTKI